MTLDSHRLTHFLQAKRSSGSLDICFELSPVHSFTSSNHCLAGLPCDLLTSTLPCNMVLFARVPFALTTCHIIHLTFLFCRSPACIVYRVLPNVFYNSPVYLHVGRMHARVTVQALGAVALFFFIILLLFLNAPNFFFATLFFSRSAC